MYVYIICMYTKMYVYILIRPPKARIRTDKTFSHPKPQKTSQLCRQVFLACVILLAFSGNVPTFQQAHACCRIYIE